jgi:hypothetical protein
VGKGELTRYAEACVCTPVGLAALPITALWGSPLKLKFPVYARLSVDDMRFGLNWPH